MAEVGFVKFTSVALRVGQVVLPAYRSKFSKHRCTEPQLLAMLCLMRHEDWTFREAEVRSAAYCELRAALSLPHGPDYTTRYASQRLVRRADLNSRERRWPVTEHVGTAG